VIREFHTRCVLDERLLVRMLRDTIDSLLAIFDDDRVAAVIWEDHRIAKAREVLAHTRPASDRQKLETAVGHINVLLDIIGHVDEGEECKKLVLRHGEDIVDAMDFAWAHAKPDPADEQPYTIVGFMSVDEFIAHLRSKQEQPDDSPDYGDEDQDWIVP
jgi:hypothetical protein